RSELCACGWPMQAPCARRPAFQAHMADLGKGPLLLRPCSPTGCQLRTLPWHVFLSGLPCMKEETSALHSMGQEVPFQLVGKFRCHARCTDRGMSSQDSDRSDQTQALAP